MDVDEVNVSARSFAGCICAPLSAEGEWCSFLHLYFLLCVPLWVNFCIHDSMTELYGVYSEVYC